MLTTFADTPYRRPSPRQEAVAQGLARLIQVYAVWQVLALIGQFAFPDLVMRVGLALSVTNIPSYPSLLSAVLLIILSMGVMRRQRAAMWVFLAVFQLPVIVYFLIAIFDPTLSLGELCRRDPIIVLSFLSSIVITLVLLWARRAFTARLAPGAWYRAGAFFAGGLALSFVIAFLGVEALRMGKVDQLDLLGWSLDAALGLAPDTMPFGHEIAGHFWLHKLCSTISAAFLLGAVAIFFAGRKHSPEADLRDELQIRRLLLTSNTEDSLGYFATRDDRSVIFSPSGKAAVSYRVVSGVALAAGDPLGDQEEWPAAIAAWLDHAHRFGRWPAVLSASEAGAKAYAAAGLHCRVMGDEAVIHTEDFRLRGPGMKPVRKAIAGPKNAGYSVRVRRQEDIDARELTELGILADLWRQGGDERGFSMASGRLGDARDGRTVIVSAHDSGGACRGLLSFVPWGRRGLSLDVMRRSPEAVSGVTEYMVSSLVEACRDLGISRVSMNFAMFRTSFALGERIGATPIQRLVRSVLVLASRWWQLQSLYRSNEKYLPQWYPRVLCYEHAAQLTAVLIAAGKAEGFLPDPGFRPVPTMPSVAAEEVAALEAELLIPPLPEEKLSEQERVRRAKAQAMTKAGLDPYPPSVPRTRSMAELPEVGDPAETSIVGRVLRIRDHGGVLFADLREGEREVQVMMEREKSTEGEHGLAGLRRYVDRGDLISVTGTMARSRTGEVSLAAREWVMAAKCLAAPPDKYHGLTDIGERVRRRHVDLALNTEARRRLLARSAAVKALRDVLESERYIEVETPILQTVHGGANARPFTTHINAYDLGLSLRIAPELYLKRLEVGGIGRVFEIGRNFRNEGADATHNPEFTALEAYEAFGDYETMRKLTQRLIRAAALAVRGEEIAPGPNGDLDLSGEWPVVTVHEAVSRATGATVTPDTPAAELVQLCRAHDISVSSSATAGALVTELYEELVEPATVEPTFYTDFPVETSPLTRPHREDPRLAERWDLVARGMELGTAYSELTDAMDQRRRFLAQSLLQAAGDTEAMEVDHDFLDALAFGMPPTGGLGLGVDRLVMFLLDASIRETLAFPFVRAR